MPKTVAPLFGFEAGGQIGKSLVYAKWRGISYARRYAVPANPNTTRQQEIRNTFKMLNAYWLRGVADVVAPWNAFAQGKPLLGSNALVKFNVAPLTYPTLAVDLEAMVFSPGAKGGLPPPSITVTPGADSLVITATPPAPPPGWTLTRAVGVAIPNQSPDAIFGGVIYTAAATMTPWTVTLSALPNVEMVAAYWLVWTKPNGDLAYSVSLSDLATPA